VNVASTFQRKNCSARCAAANENTAREALNKSGFRDAVENVVLVDTAPTLNGGDESGETADVRGPGVAEQRKADAA
jgi:hypothetical protein